MHEKITSGQCWSCGRTKEELEQHGISLPERTMYAYGGGTESKGFTVEVCEICNHITE